MLTLNPIRVWGQLARPPGVPQRRFGALPWFLLAVGLIIIPGRAGAGEPPPAQQEEITRANIGRVLPGVVGIVTDVSAEVTIRCRKNGTFVVTPDSDRENGTGFLIHPDGWIATNGHVVKPVYKDDAEHRATFLQVAADAACGPALKTLPASQRRKRLAAILQDRENRKGVKLTKTLAVFLPAEKRTVYPAVVKAYSGPIEPTLLPKDGSLPTPPMLDGAIIKIEATNLPVVRLAPSTQQVYLGDQVFIVGYPGVVLWHDYLSKKSRAEATVTYGRISAFRLDVNDRQILQTDASISWGDSGGPAFNSRGEVIGLATFISTSLEGDQAIQGFNFLIPIDTIHAMAQGIGVTPLADSPFTQAWNQAMDAVAAGRYREALTHAEAADTILPGLIDVRRIITRLRAGLQGKP